MVEDGSPRQIQSLVRAGEIIQHLRRSDGATLSDVASAVDLSPGSVHTYLATLKQLGYVVQRDNVYALSPQFVTLGEYVRNRSPLYRAAKSEVDTLADRTGEAVHLIVEHQGRGIALYERLGADAVGTDYHRRLRQQQHQHLHCTASGKAILAALPAEWVRRILDEHGLQARTPNTITNRADLFDVLGETAERGVAVNDEEEVLGIYAVGAAISGPAGVVHGALSISAPKARMEDDDYHEEIVSRVRQAVNVAEVNLQTEDLP